ncbi:PDR/VanB family oxidoreductase [Gordonia aurantiaca]|uniref:PDR/VanB family oxidoreductase n=1 Tax=Gordonia sp. B21 TaxID=3151852 RepID=UPI003264ABEC
MTVAPLDTTTADPSAATASGSNSAGEWIDVQVASVEHPARDVVLLRLRSADGTALPAWTPGSHVDVELEPETIRQYSLCGTAGDDEWSVAVLLEPDGRGGSQLAHQLAVGDRVRVRGPRNNFALAPAERYVFIAGGIGVTPILPMIREVHARGAQWTLHYGGRTRDRMAFAGDLVEQYGENVVVYPEDEVGRIDISGIIDGADGDTFVYCCGPSGLLDAAESAASELGCGTLRVERFHGDGQGATRPGDVAFDVECSISGITVTVAEDETILDALERVGGVVIASSCREGTCGTCEAGVLEGVPDHRDSILTAEECRAGDVIMTCVSRAQSPKLVLEL